MLEGFTHAPKPTPLIRFVVATSFTSACANTRACCIAHQRPLSSRSCQVVSAACVVHRVQAVKPQSPEPLRKREAAQLRCRIGLPTISASLSVGLHHQRVDSYINLKLVVVCFSNAPHDVQRLRPAQRPAEHNGSRGHAMSF